MLDEVKKIIEKENMVKAGEWIVAGVSGGADSICLLFVLQELSEELGIRLAAVHVNHGIRGEEAQRDAAFTQETCKRLGVPFRLFKRNIPKMVQQMGLSEEEAGRMARYECLSEACREFGAEKIAVAHNKNDDAETFLFHLFRGSGPGGLSGMKPVMVRPDGMTVIRPLLRISRGEIEAWLEERGISHVTDSTNASLCYSRNRIREKILPEAGKVNEQAAAHILEAAGLIRELYEDAGQQAAAWLGQHASGSEQSAKEGTAGAVCLPVKDFLKLPGSIQSQVLRQALLKAGSTLTDLTHVHLEALLQLTGKQTGKQICLPGGIRAQMEYGSLRLSREKVTEPAKPVFLPDFLPGEEVTVAAREKTFHFVLCEASGEEKIPENRYTKWLDYDKIKDRLVLRTRQQGDWFQAFSDGRTQSVNAWMKNERIPAGSRDEILLLAAGGHVFWIIGGRISEAGKCTEQTRRILKITVCESEEPGAEAADKHA